MYQLLIQKPKKSISAPPVWSGMSLTDEEEFGEVEELEAFGNHQALLIHLPKEKRFDIFPFKQTYLFLLYVLY